MSWPGAASAALIGLGCLGAGLYGGMRLQNAQLAKELAACHSDAAQAMQAGKTLERVRFEDALRAHDAATRTLQTSRQALAKQLEKTRRDLQTLTTGRACLDADAIGVLQRSPAFTPDAGAAMPTPARQPARAAAGVATDTDVAGWMATAADQYEACRARIRAIAQWEQQVNGR
ncbi:hypothetical protein [Rhodoferax sp.]|uniref:hypothetical protein n=1 Tax=Rhodoferax sp. TaxID=50421 RepID=UPI0026176228|nr:hypothetical protein [Rhodoferax sp.]MDD3938030.1 hypothetical protein [Rhodoferax sp.]